MRKKTLSIVGLMFRADSGNEARIHREPPELDRSIPGMKVGLLADPKGNILELCEGVLYEDQ